MTETEWLACADPDMLLDELLGKVSRERLVEYVRLCWERIKVPLPAVPAERTAVEEFAALAPDQSDFDAAFYADEAAIKAARLAPDFKAERRQQAALLRRLVARPA